MAVLNPYNYAKPKGALNRRNTLSNSLEKFSSNQNGGATRTRPVKAANNDQYLEQKVMSSSPEGLTLMLYEGALKFIRQAKLFNEEKNIEKTSNAIIRAEAIYSELQSTLNMEYPIGQELDRLYDYVQRRLAEANISKDNEILSEIELMTEEFRDTWKEAMKKVGK